MTAKDGLSADETASIFQDREDGAWIGTLYRELNLVNRNSVEFYSVENGLAAKVVNPFFEDAAGAIWLDDGLARFAGNRFNRISEREKYFRGEVTAIGEDRANRLWFGHWNGAYYLQNGVYTNFTERFGERPPFSTVTKTGAEIVVPDAKRRRRRSCTTVWDGVYQSSKTRLSLKHWGKTENGKLKMNRKLQLFSNRLKF